MEFVEALVPRFLQDNDISLYKMSEINTFVNDFFPLASSCCPGATAEVSVREVHLPSRKSVWLLDSCLRAS